MARKARHQRRYTGYVKDVETGELIKVNTWAVTKADIFYGRKTQGFITEDGKAHLCKILNYTFVWND